MAPQRQTQKIDGVANIKPDKRWQHFRLSETRLIVVIRLVIDMARGHSQKARLRLGLFPILASKGMKRVPVPLQTGIYYEQIHLLGYHQRSRGCCFVHRHVTGRGRHPCGDCPAPPAWLFMARHRPNLVLYRGNIHRERHCNPPGNRDEHLSQITNREKYNINY